MLRSFQQWGRAFAGAAALAAATSAYAQKELVFGLQCDRTGPTQTVGVFLCPGYHDYIALVNSKGGINGSKVKVVEIDTEYKVPAAVEALFRTDLALKSSGGDPRVLIERLVVELCG